MNDDDLTPEDDMQAPGDNIVQSEKQVGSEALKLIRRYETLLNKHDKILGEIHATIIEFGRKLQIGLDMYGPGREFGWWIERRRLNTGKIAYSQQERTACMLIARLHDYGVEVDDDGDGSTTPARLDLTDCKRTTPTDIMKWAREKQRHLFPHLAPRKAAKPPAVPNDDIPDLGEDREDACSFCDRVASEVVTLIAAAKPAIFICDECVDQCVQTLAEQKTKSKAKAKANPGPSWSSPIGAKPLQK